MFSQQAVSLMNKRFADLYRNTPNVTPAPALIKQAVEEVDFWFNRIPLPVQWTPNQEPYATFEDMCADIRRGSFRVKDYVGSGYMSPLWQETYNKMRAVHDYFGHFEGNNGFGIIGELSAYGVHVGMFSPEICPLIFNEIVLTNATRDTYGSAEDKFVPFAAM